MRTGVPDAAKVTRTLRNLLRADTGRLDARPCRRWNMPTSASLPAAEITGAYTKGVSSIVRTFVQESPPFSERRTSGTPALFVCAT